MNKIKIKQARVSIWISFDIFQKSDKKIKQTEMDYHGQFSAVLEKCYETESSVEDDTSLNATRSLLWFILPKHDQFQICFEQKAEVFECEDNIESVT